jgi:alpha-tubulin suppressor-like RCC1 family protein
MLKTPTALVVGPVLASVCTFSAFALQDDCQALNSWHCGSGAFLEQPTGLNDVTAIDAGDIFSVALRSTGQVVVWGTAPYDPVEVSGGFWNEPYLLPPEAQFRTTAIAAGQEHGTLLLSDGTLIEWHQDVTPAHSVYSERFSDVIALAAGGDGPVQDVWNGQPHHPFLLVLDGSGAITVFGDNVSGALGNVAFSIQNVPKMPGTVRAIAAGRSHALALTERGFVIGWGSDDQGASSVPDSLDGEHVMAIAAGKDHSLAVRSDGSVVAWGANQHGQCEVPEDLAGVVGVAAGEGHSVAVRSDGTVVAWGANEFGQTQFDTPLTGVRSVACGRWHSVALHEDGTITAWGDDRFGQSGMSPRVTSEPIQISKIAVGGDHRMVLNSDGTVLAWGSNQHGQIEVPSGLDSVSGISAGAGFSLAVRDDGTVRAWGRNDEGQCDVPFGLEGVLTVRAGAAHVLALHSDGTVSAWGGDDAGQCAVPVDLNDVIAIAAGDEHSLALRVDGTVVAWGSDQFGQIQTPPHLEGIRSIGAGGSHSLAVDANGVVIAWGANEKGQSEVPQGLPSIVSVQAGALYSIARAADGQLFAWGECGERRPGPPFSNRHYSATWPQGVDGHVLVAAGPDDVMSLRDLCAPCVQSDLNRDHTVDERDLIFLHQFLGQPCVGDGSQACAADLNHDGGVGMDDLSILLQQWGPCSMASLRVPMIRSVTTRQ